MENFFVAYENELLGSAICLTVFVLLRFAILTTIRRFGRKSDINLVRTRLVMKYITFALFVLLLVALVLVWGIKVRELGLIISSVFAVIGVALFATWSILSNVTAGIVLFFSFPYKIGDRIKILDKDFPEEAIIIDIRTFSVTLIKDDGSLLTYPNNLLLQKGVVLLQKEVATSDDMKQTF